MSKLLISKALIRNTTVIIIVLEVYENGNETYQQGIQRAYI